MTDTRTLVTIFALIAGSLCLVVYFVEIYLAEKIKTTATTAAATTNPTSMVSGAIGPASVTMPEFTSLIEAMAKLADSLAKVGPSLTSLLGAVLFFALAAIGSGALQSPPAPAKTNISGNSTDSRAMGAQAVSRNRVG